MPTTRPRTRRTAAPAEWHSAPAWSDDLRSQLRLKRDDEMRDIGHAHPRPQLKRLVRQIGAAQPAQQFVDDGSLGLLDRHCTRVSLHRESRCQENIWKNKVREDWILEVP